MYIGSSCHTILEVVTASEVVEKVRYRQVKKQDDFENQDVREYKE